jgi:hypothetical protein
MSITTLMGVPPPSPPTIMMLPSPPTIILSSLPSLDELPSLEGVPPPTPPTTNVTSKATKAVKRRKPSISSDEESEEEEEEEEVGGAAPPLSPPSSNKKAKTMVTNSLPPSNPTSDTERGLKGAAGPLDPTVHGFNFDKKKPKRGGKPLTKEGMMREQINDYVTNVANPAQVILDLSVADLVRIVAANKKMQERSQKFFAHIGSNFMQDTMTNGIDSPHYIWIQQYLRAILLSGNLTADIVQELIAAGLTTYEASLLGTHTGPQQLGVPPLTEKKKRGLRPTPPKEKKAGAAGASPLTPLEGKEEKKTKKRTSKKKEGEEDNVTEEKKSKRVVPSLRNVIKLICNARCPEAKRGPTAPKPPRSNDDGQGGQGGSAAAPDVIAYLQTKLSQLDPSDPTYASYKLLLEGELRPPFNPPASSSEL